MSKTDRPRCTPCPPRTPRNHPARPKVWDKSMGQNRRTQGSGRANDNLAFRHASLFGEPPLDRAHGGRPPCGSPCAASSAACRSRHWRQSRVVQTLPLRDVKNPDSLIAFSVLDRGGESTLIHSGSHRKSGRGPISRFGGSRNTQSCGQLRGARDDREHGRVPGIPGRRPSKGPRTTREPRRSGDGTKGTTGSTDVTRMHGRPNEERPAAIASCRCPLDK